MDTVKLKTFITTWYASSEPVAQRCVSVVRELF